MGGGETPVPGFSLRATVDIDERVVSGVLSYALVYTR